MNKKKRIVVAITGATGGLYAIRLLELLRDIEGIESHLILSDSGAINMRYELGISRRVVESMADFKYSIRDIGATLASGTFQTDGMLIVPCSMKTLSAVANGFSDNLITRAADVILKERRRLLLVVRETPFNLSHLHNMTSITQMGGIIFPPLPAFYCRPKSIEEMVTHTVSRILGFFDIQVSHPIWKGISRQEKRNFNQTEM